MVVLGLLVLIVVGTIIGMTQVSLNVFHIADVVFNLSFCPHFIFSIKPITNSDSCLTQSCTNPKPPWPPNTEVLEQFSEMLLKPRFAGS